jgi:outer membrane immunogenic protein
MMTSRLIRGVMTVAVVAGGTTVAFAADMPTPVPVYSKAPMMAPAYSWTGLYIGGNVGYSWMSSTDQIVGTDPGGTAFIAGFGIPTALPLSASSFIGGGQVGYNWQFAPAWVVGVEADYSGTHLDATTTVVSTGNTRPMTATQTLDTLGTVRGRLGVTPVDRVLTYFTGGYAYGNGSLSTALSNVNGCAGNNCQAGATSGTLSGWTIGGGVEWAFAGNWIARAEYLYVDLGSLSHPMRDPGFPLNNFAASADFKSSIVRAALSYKF